MDIDDDLEKRRGEFLHVEQFEGRYRETSLSGEAKEYKTIDDNIELVFERLALHTTSDVKTGIVREILTGTSREYFRAIGTEGEYPIFNVVVGSDLPAGSAILRCTYAQGGHSLSGEMSIGLPDGTVKAFGQRLPGELRIGGIEAGVFYEGATRGKTILLDHWRDHVVSESNSENITVEWRLCFSTTALSPQGYSSWLGYTAPSRGHREVSGRIKIIYDVAHPLTKNLDKFADIISESIKNITRALFIIVILIAYISFKLWG